MCPSPLFLRACHFFSVILGVMIIEEWGVIPYQQAFDQQKTIVQDIINGGDDRVILCEHPPVLTLGRMTNPDSLLYTRDDIIARGVEIVSVDRGGDVTLHAPGQLIVYPIINLANHNKDLKRYMMRLEQVAVDLLTDFGILAKSIEGKRGVFVGPRKIISIGVGVRKWVSYHGLGINVATDLRLFQLIKPCGLDVSMTSMSHELKRAVSMDEVKARMTTLIKTHLKA